MDLIHSTFQASFNARIERLQEQETNELRTIFRYFDTDGDGAVSADQVLRIFGLLGLSINPAYVRDLGEVYLAEFLKIIDSHVPVAAATMPTDQGGAATPNGSASIVPLLATATMSTGATNNASGGTDADQVAVPSPQEGEAAQERANAQLWEDEWRVLDSYGRGVISRDELCLLLRSCFSPFPVHDLDRFLELYADPSMPEDSMTLTKAAFLRFRRDYTARERAQSEHNGDSSDDENEGEAEAEGAGSVDLALVDQTLRGGSAAAVDGDNQEAQDPESRKLRAKRAGEAYEGDDGPTEGSGDVDGIFIDPGVMVDDFVDEDDGGATVAASDHGDGGGEDDGTFYGEDDEEEGDGEADEDE